MNVEAELACQALPASTPYGKVVMLPRNDLLQLDPVAVTQVGSMEGAHVET